MAQVFTDDRFEDFSRGTLDASGQNMYVSRDGKVRSIHHFDYDRDGYIDLLLPQTHDTYSDIPPTFCAFNKKREIIQNGLEVRGAIQAVAADLDKDGFQDLVFCPNYNGTQHPRDFLTIVYGGPDGWPAGRSRSGLPVFSVKSVAVADLNHDGWPDIVALNGKPWLPGHPAGEILRVFWGGDQGFIPKRSIDLGMKGARSLAATDFNGDGFTDLALLNADSGLTVFQSPVRDAVTAANSALQLPIRNFSATSLNTGDINNDGIGDLIVGTKQDALLMFTGRRSGGMAAPQIIQGIRATHASVGDVDGDRQNDLILSYLSTANAMGGEMTGATSGSGQSVSILWGDKRGFSASRRFELPAQRLSAAACGDFDGDGLQDIAVAINKGKESFTTHALIYFGKGGRQFDQAVKGPTTTGASDVMVVKAGKDAPDQLVFCNSTGGTVDERVPAYLYWGSKGGFNARPRTEIPFRSGYESSAADLNADGYPDIIIMDEMHGGQGMDEDPLAGANIFWGRQEGFDFSEQRRTVLSESYLGSSNIGDLDKDGYLDLVLGQFTVEGFESGVIIYHGNGDGYAKTRRTFIPCPGRSLGIQLADYNKDGWLDIAANALSEDKVRIFWGSPAGFDVNRKKELEVTAVCDLETADLNRDGWLDLIAASYDDMNEPNHNDMGTTIFWGSGDGFRHNNAQWLPGSTPLGPVVADFDADGYLDLFCPSYHASGTREMTPSHLYWGGPNGLQRKNRTSLINDSGAEGLAADFDKDGRLDLFVANHATNGSHYAKSKVLYNDGQRFSQPRIELIETRGPHWSHNEDMGHIYDRSWTQHYESTMFEYPSSRSQGILTYRAEMASGTKLLFQVRSAANKKDIQMAGWRDVDPSGKFNVVPIDRCVQYRARFISDNGDRYPVLDRVSLKIDE